MLKPLLDMVEVRSQDTLVDEKLRAGEERGREQLMARSARGTESMPECFGVWIDHEDYEGAPPGVTWGQCSLGVDCRVKNGRAAHVSNMSCHLLFSACPRCDVESV